MKSFINEAAENCGWKAEKIIEKGDYLTKYSKNGYYFYSDGISTIPINNQSPNIAVNKVHTSVILENENIPCIKTREINFEEIEHVRGLYYHFANESNPRIVLKPIDGNKSEGLLYYDSLKELEDFSIIAPKNKRYCISSYFAHLCEIRFILFRNSVEFYYLKPNNESNHLRPIIDKTINLHEDTISKLRNLAEKASVSLGFDYLSIDFLIGNKDEKIIEVNLNPNLYSLIRNHPEFYQRCVELFEKMFNYKEQLLLERIKKSYKQEK
ncbi:hypothetical protein ACFSO7_01090 [Bacillus sp. CGMCC 1.16607]|uniref:hypothetical protein n=1 Tax=Bacillus sp. CGMCC 1.16607 TaxID=3351842 RepID=UPI00362A2AEB